MGQLKARDYASDFDVEFLNRAFESFANEPNETFINFKGEDIV